MSPFSLNDFKNVFNKAGDDIKNEVIKPVEKLFTSPVDMGAIRTTVGFAADGVGFIPGGGVVLGVSVGIADAATGGKGSLYLNDGSKFNTTLNLIPGGRLAQDIANRASGGRTGREFTSVEHLDPKKDVISYLMKTPEITHTTINDIEKKIPKPVILPPRPIIRPHRPISILHQTILETIPTQTINNTQITPVNTIQPIIDEPPKPKETIPESAQRNFKELNGFSVPFQLLGLAILLIGIFT